MTDRETVCLLDKENENTKWNHGEKEATFEEAPAYASHLFASISGEKTVGKKGSDYKYPPAHKVWLKCSG